jgi:UDP-2,3-diacylglucosamine hydrolase
MRAIFISDLHLHPNDAATQARFDAFIRVSARGAGVLYVLGDLLHVWLGDAMLADDAYAQSITAQFAALSRSGTKIYLARGNRDFMIGREFVKAANATLLEEQTLIELGGRRALLLHGDELCTDDVRYQRARRVLRTNLFRIVGNALPRPFRHAIARKLRRESDQHKANTSMAIMDVNAQAVDRVMKRHNAQLLIHGHTHRPSHHTLSDGRERRVLSDWQQDYGYLEYLNGDFTVRPWPGTTTEALAGGQKP